VIFLPIRKLFELNQTLDAKIASNQRPTLEELKAANSLHAEADRQFQQIVSKIPSQYGLNENTPLKEVNAIPPKYLTAEERELLRVHLRSAELSRRFLAYLDMRM